jgi:diaminopimelate epimerase
MNFWKLHGAGNDFIIFDNRDSWCTDLSGLARAACSRRSGVGADGLMAVGLSDAADIRMHFYNADGSLAAMCGNGIRCFSKYVRDNSIVGSAAFTVETGDGVKSVSMQSESEVISVVRVSMGAGGEMRDLDLSSFGVPDKAVFLQVGVPHTMLFINEGQEGHANYGSVNGAIPSQSDSAFDPPAADTSSFPAELISLTEKYGPQIEKAPLFAEGTNVNFVLPAGKDQLLVSTWERGAGRTLACGTGACASAAAAYRLGLTGSRVRVRMPGGEVTVTIAADGALLMEGEACLVCKGESYL